MNRKEFCNNCRYSDNEYRPHEDKYQCRRHAPQILALHDYRDGSLKAVTRFPMVFGRLWCGDWEPQEQETLSE